MRKHHLGYLGFLGVLGVLGFLTGDPYLFGLFGFRKDPAAQGSAW